MPKHKFAAGDRVAIYPDRLKSYLRPGVYTILQALPESGSGFRYRARNALDKHDCVVDEVELNPVRA